ncbi:hypothetical protein J5N97_014918 [Dioscorea zingiberensis]|uniref:Uncharacterized protein n=1 Tax=Dioscorea zingiberensis TaxID=325984 RepID=A0A9D5HK33_9LILI|nr:hypothetical protein J5N97_014918 [Dioscorea zingiberensis]
MTYLALQKPGLKIKHAKTCLGSENTVLVQSTVSDRYYTHCELGSPFTALSHSPEVTPATETQMTLQDGGWPLGLVRNLDFSGSLSFSTLITGSSSSSSVSSSDLDTESTRSFFHERSITLGSIIGFSETQDSLKEKKSQKSRACFSLCSMTQFINCQKSSATPSLGHFLEAERRRNQAPITYELHGLPENNKPSLESNTLFSNGFIAPPQAGGNESLVLVGDVKKHTCWLW